MGKKKIPKKAVKKKPKKQPAPRAKKPAKPRAKKAASQTAEARQPAGPHVFEPGELAKRQEEREISGGEEPAEPGAKPPAETAHPAPSPDAAAKAAAPQRPDVPSRPGAAPAAPGRPGLDPLVGRSQVPSATPQPSPAPQKERAAPPPAVSESSAAPQPGTTLQPGERFKPPSESEKHLAIKVQILEGKNEGLEHELEKVTRMAGWFQSQHDLVAAEARAQDENRLHYTQAYRAVLVQHTEEGRALEGDKARLKESLKRGPTGRYLAFEGDLYEIQDAKEFLKREENKADEFLRKAAERQAEQRSRVEEDETDKFMREFEAKQADRMPGRILGSAGRGPSPVPTELTSRIKKLKKAIDDAPNSVVYIKESARAPPTEENPNPKQVYVMVRVTDEERELGDVEELTAAQTELRGIALASLARVKGGLVAKGLSRFLKGKNIKAKEDGSFDLTEEDIELIRSQAPELAKENAVLTASGEEDKRAIAELRNRITSLRESIRDADAETSKLGQERSAEQQRIAKSLEEQLREQLRATSEALDKETKARTGLEAKLAKVAKRLPAYIKEAQENTASINTKYITELQQQIKDLQKELAKARRNLEGAVQDRSRITRAVEAREAELKADYEPKLQKRAAENKRLKGEISAREERVSSLEAQLKQKSARIAGLSRTEKGLREKVSETLEGHSRLVNEELPRRTEEAAQNARQELTAIFRREIEAINTIDTNFVRNLRAKYDSFAEMSKEIGSTEPVPGFSEFSRQDYANQLESRSVHEELRAALTGLYEAKIFAADLNAIRDVNPEKFMEGPEALKELSGRLANDESRELLAFMQQLYAASKESVKKTPVLSARVRAEDTPQGKLYRSLLYNMIKVVSGNEWKTLIGADPSIPDYYKRDEFKDAAGIFAEFSKKIEESQAGKANEMQLELEKMAAELGEKDKAHAVAHAAYEEESEKRLGELRAASERVSGEYDAYKKDAGERIEGLNAKMGGLESQAAAANKERDNARNELEKARQGYEADRKDAGEMIDGLNTNIGELEKKVAAIGKERDGLSAELKKKKTEDDGYVAKTSRKIQDLNSQLKQSQAEVAIANEERNGLKTKLEQARQEYEKKKGELEGKAAAASKEGDGAKGALEKARQGYELNRKDAEKRIDGLNTNIGDLEKKVAAIGEERDGLSAELKKKKAEDEAYVTKTSGKIQDLTARLKKTESDLGARTKERDSARAELETARKEHEAYKGTKEKEIEGLNTRIGGLEKNLATTTNERNGLAKETRQKETAYERVRQAFEGGYSLRSTALARLDEATALGLEEASLIKQTYSAARKIIEQGEGRRSESKEAVRLLVSMRPKFNVATEINLFGSLEYAKWVAYKARKTEDHTERLRLYEDAKAILHGALRTEPNFRGAQLYLDKYSSESALVEDNYARAMVIIRHGNGDREENKEAIELLMSIQPKANVSKPLGLVRNLEYAKSLAGSAERTQDPAERADIYDKSIQLLKGILCVDPQFRGARLCLDMYSIDATVTKKAAVGFGSPVTF